MQVQLVRGDLHRLRKEEEEVRERDRVRVDGHQPGGWLVAGDRGHGLERLAAGTPPVQVVADDDRRGGKRPLDVSVGERRVDRDVRAHLLVHERRGRIHRLCRVDDRVEKLVLNFDQVARVLGHVAARRDDRGDRLSDESHLVGGHASPRMPIGGRAEVRHRIAELHRLEARHHRSHTRQLAGSFSVDADDAGVRVGAPKRRGMKHPGTDRSST